MTTYTLDQEDIDFIEKWIKPPYSIEESKEISKTYDTLLRKDVDLETSSCKDYFYYCLDKYPQLKDKNPVLVSYLWNLDSFMGYHYFIKNSETDEFLLSIPDTC